MTVIPLLFHSVIPSIVWAPLTTPRYSRHRGIVGFANSGHCFVHNNLSIFLRLHFDTLPQDEAVGNSISSRCHFCCHLATTGSPLLNLTIDILIIANSVLFNSSLNKQCIIAVQYIQEYTILLYIVYSCTIQVPTTFCNVHQYC